MVIPEKSGSIKVESTDYIFPMTMYPWFQNIKIITAYEKQNIPSITIIKLLFNWKCVC